ncbi:MAG: triose-phosphate isomerase [Gemmatimonadota bacterium]
MTVELKKPVIAGNWKMFKGPTEARTFFARFSQAYAARNDRTIVIFPSAVALGSARAALDGRTDVNLGVQNIHWEEQGAFTGETSAPQARDAGAQFALIGHSERRHVFGETDDEVRQKVAAALRNSLTPVICVGETLAEREAGQVNAVITRQLSTALNGIGADTDTFLVAYEPVWAIGTGVTATPADASDAHAILRMLLASDRFSNREIPILYGGSVKPDNAADLLAAAGVDGLLVGGASLDAAGFARICAAG